jgi:hypothetical protein
MSISRMDFEKIWKIFENLGRVKAKNGKRRKNEREMRGKV